MTEAQTLAVRVAQLERRVRRLIGVTVAAVVVALVGAMIALARPVFAQSDAHGVVSAHTFKVLDQNHRLRAILTSPSNGPTAGSTVLAFFDSAGKVRAELTVSANGTPKLDLADAHGKPRAELEVEKYGTPSLDLGDAHGRVRMKASVASGGQPRLSLFTIHGNGIGERARLGLNKDGIASLNLYGANEHIRLALGQAHLRIPTTGLAETTGPSSITLYGNIGNLIWRAP